MTQDEQVLLLEAEMGKTVRFPVVSQVGLQLIQATIKKVRTTPERILVEFNEVDAVINALVIDVQDNGGWRRIIGDTG